MYRIELTGDLERLLSDTDSWTGLAGGIPFREKSWLSPWWAHLGTGRQAYVLVARDTNEQVCGVLPLYVSHSNSQGRTLSLIGDGQACTDYASILAFPGQAIEIAIAMAEFLIDQATDADDAWDFIDLDGVVEDDPVMIAFARTLADHGASVHAQSRMSTWFKPSDASWDEHLKHFKKTQRRQMRRWSERVKTTPGMELVHPSNMNEVHCYLDHMIAMHQRRWTEAGEPGSFSDPDFIGFVHDVAANFFERDQLHLSLLLLQGEPIAGDFSLVGGNRRLYCYSNGYDIDSADLEPGRILMVESIKHMYRHELHGIDYMRGDEPYKRRMAAIPTRILHVRVAAPALWPRLCHAAWWTGFEVKQWLRRRTGRAPVEVINFAGSLPVAH